MGKDDKKETPVFYITDDGGPPLGGRPPGAPERPSTPPLPAPTTWESIFPFGGPQPYDLGPPPPYLVARHPVPTCVPPPATIPVCFTPPGPVLFVFGPPSPPSPPTPPTPTSVHMIPFPSVGAFPVVAPSPPPPPQVQYSQAVATQPTAPPRSRSQRSSPYPDGYLAHCSRQCLLTANSSIIIHLIPRSSIHTSSSGRPRVPHQLEFDAHVVPNSMTLDQLLEGITVWGIGQSRRLRQLLEVGDGEWIWGSIYRGGSEQNGGRGATTLGGPGGFGWGGAGWRNRGPIWLVYEE